MSDFQRRCATSPEAPGSIPGGVTGFSSDIFASDRTTTIVSRQPLVKMSTRNIPMVKGGLSVRVAKKEKKRKQGKFSLYD
jgi:hypothetical protein